MRILIQAILVLLILGGAGALAARLVATKPPTPRLTAPRPPPLVEVLTVQNAALPAEIRARGTLQARSRPVLSAQVAGAIAWIAPELEPGAAVEAGQELVRLDPADRELAVRRLQAELAEAEARLRVDDTLVHRARLAAVRAQLAQAELDLARTVVRAPVAGWVSERLVEPGQFVAPGTWLARLTERRLEAVVDLDETDLPLLPELPAPATVQVDGEELPAELQRLAPERDARLRRVRAHAVVAGEPGPRWRPGAFAVLRLAGRPLPPACALPEHALLPGGRVWTVADGRLQGRAVEIVRQAAGRVWIGGLPDGAEVVVTRLEVATEGMAVRVAGRP